MAYETTRYYDASLFGLEAIEESIASLEKRVAYLPEAERHALIDTCFYAAIAHREQRRKSGGPYICHPIKVAEILANEVQFDLPVLQAAVLHDVIEDTPFSKAQVTADFSEEVANLVDGVTKLEKDEEISAEELQALTFAKLVEAMEADPRVVMIKFADRMHNLQTLDSLRPEKRRRIAKETLDVYVPIAGRLGMFVFKNEMENLSFKHLYPWRYRAIAKLANDTHPEREAIYGDVKAHLQEQFKSLDIQASIRKRRRNLFDIYQRLKKSRQSHLPIKRASIPIIIITDTIDECYRILGIIHKGYTPVFKKLADYIASPKANGYQSIHTSVLTENRRLLNFQIRTKSMHAVAESGIIAIWRQHNVSKSNSANPHLQRDKSMRRWLENIKDLSNIANNPLEFYKAVKRDLTDSKIQVLTPKGEPIPLPEGACVIDFAYYIHTDLGNHLKSAKVNDLKVPLDYSLSHGQMVELSVSSSASPESAWLKCVKTERATTAIRHYLRKLPKEKLAELGLEEMRNHLSKRKIHYRHLEAMLETVAEAREMTLDALLTAIVLHTVKRKTIRSELQQLAYQSDVTTVLHVQMENQPGALGTVADTIGKHGGNILRIEFPSDLQAKRVTMLFETRTETPDALNNITGDLLLQPLVKRVQREEILNEKHHID